MKQELSPEYHALEQRLGLLRELAGSLESAQAAVLRSDLAEMNLQTARQHELCAALRPAVGGGSSVPGERWSRLLRESANMEMRVARLNREYGALLRRARRTVDIFCRVLANSETTYVPPQRDSATFHPGLRG